jgi:hypothetical protein
MAWRSARLDAAQQLGHITVSIELPCWRAQPTIQYSWYL